jgi:general secretion pathway protein E
VVLDAVLDLADDATMTLPIGIPGEPAANGLFSPYADFAADLLAHKLVSVSDLARAQGLAADTQTALPQVLARLGLVAAEILIERLAAVTGCARAAEPLTLLALLPADLNPGFLLTHGCAPLAETSDTLTVATADPLNEDLRDGLAFACAKATIIQIASETAIARALAKLSQGTYDQGAGVSALACTDALSGDLTRLEDASSDAPVVRLVNRLIQEANGRGASDIHFEALPRALMVRYRIDGDLREIEQLPDSLSAPVVSRIKVMAGLDIAEKRLPQDGRIRTAVEGRDLDIRVSTTPTVQGEGVVLRLLGRTNVTLDLDRLGLSDQAVTRLKEALSRPNGIILLTGPTGSGKTTTLYAALERLKSPTTKILTVEDPVEYMIPGVNQVQVKPEIGLTYAAALRAFLRQDPNILLVGEIRDKETADIAIRAAHGG